MLLSLRTPPAQVAPCPVCRQRAAPENLPLVPNFLAISCRIPICNSEHNWNKTYPSVQSHAGTRGSAGNTCCWLLPARVLHASPAHLFLLLPSALWSNFLQINHPNPHGTMTAKGLQQGCSKAFLVLSTPSPPAPASPMWILNAQQRNVGARPAAGSGLGIRQIYSPAASKLSAIHPILHARFLPSLRHNHCSGWPKIYANRYAKGWQLQQQPLLYVSRLGACCTISGSCSIIPQGLERGQGHHEGLGCQMLHQQQLSFSKPCTPFLLRPAEKAAKGFLALSSDEAFPSCRSCKAHQKQLTALVGMARVHFQAVHLRSGWSPRNGRLAPGDSCQSCAQERHPARVTSRGHRQRPGARARPFTGILFTCCSPFWCVCMRVRDCLQRDSALSGL